MSHRFLPGSVAHLLRDAPICTRPVGDPQSWVSGHARAGERALVIAVVGPDLLVCVSGLLGWAWSGLFSPDPGEAVSRPSPVQGDPPPW